MCVFSLSNKKGPFFSANGNEGKRSNSQKSESEVLAGKSEEQMLLRNFCLEMQVLMALRHPHVVLYLGK